MHGVSVTKMHGALNDFVLVDRRTQHVDDVQSFARWICDRRAGVGADGLLLIEHSTIADARMRIINADGGEAEMCGNGIRCTVRFLSEAGEGDHFRIETLAGLIESDVLQKGETYRVRVNTGKPIFESRTLPANAQYVRVGNAHAVVFEDPADPVDLLALGREMPELNVHATIVAGSQRLSVRHYERGAGFTSACGTGSVACACEAIRSAGVQSPVEVHVPGGMLCVEWDGNGNTFLSGPAVRVFDAEV